MKIPLSLIKPSPRPVRSSWDEEKLNELAQSIKEQGLIVPVKVRPVGEEYELVFGHRRVEAARRAGLEEVEAIVEGVDDTAALIQALIENVQREDIAPMDLAYGLKALQELTEWNQSEMARHGIMPQRTISRVMALLKQPAEIQNLVIRGSMGGNQGTHTPEGKISPRHVQTVQESGISHSGQTQVLKKAAREGLSTTQTRRVAEAVAATPDPVKRKVLLETDARSPAWEELATIRTKAKKQKQAEWWEQHPSTKELLGLLRMYRRLLNSTWESAREEKIAPEHLPYLIRRIREVVADLQSMIEQLEGKAAKYR